MTAEPLSLIARLKRHHMFRVASWYATAAWVIILIANQVFPDIGLTRADVRVVIAVVALGFPVVLVLAWMFIPPSAETPTTLTSWKRLRWRLGAVFALAVIAFVMGSSVYLWRYDGLRLDNNPVGEEQSRGKSTEVIVVLPFEKLGVVDDAMVAGLQGTIETNLVGLANVRVVSHNAFPIATGSKPSLADIAKATGATLAIQGYIQHSDAASNYIVHLDLISMRDTESLHSSTDSYSALAPIPDIEQQMASRAVGPVRFLTRQDDWLAQGYRTTNNQRAMQLLRQALMNYYYDGDANNVALLREALDLDQNFAQAHAYLAFFINVEDNSPASRNAVDDEIERATILAPGLPEAELARGMVAFLRQDNAAAARILVSLETPLARNFLMHYFYGRALRYLGRWEDALHEINAAAAIDPFQLYTTNYAAVIEYANRDYEAADGLLSNNQQRWPLSPGPRLWHAQVGFAYHGDLAALASIVNGGWGAYLAEGDWLAARRIEVAHLQGRHAEVISLLKSYPKEYLQATLFWTILGRTLFADSLSVESLRLMDRDDEARTLSRLDLPHALDEARNPKDPIYTFHLALLQAFGDDQTAALETIEPWVKRLQQSPERWNGDDAGHSTDVAIVLAWCGKKQQAIDLLQHSFTATWGAHAAIVAHDPVWRPLYKEPAFVALLAAHGQQLAYAH